MIFSIIKDCKPLGRAAQQRGARTGPACAGRTARVRRLQPTGQALVTALSRGEGVALIFEIPAFLRERIPRLLDVAPSDRARICQLFDNSARDTKN